MAIEEVVGIPTEVISQLGQIGMWLQAIGAIVVIWIVVQIISLIIERKKMKTIQYLRDEVIELQKKMDKLLVNQIKKK